MRLKLTSLLLISLILGACAAKIIPDRYLATPDEAAYLVGSIGVQLSGENRSPNSFSTLFFRQVGDEEKAVLMVSQTPLVRDEVDYKNAEKRGSVFSLPLKPGRYEIVNVSFFYNSGQVEKTYTAEEDFSIPFTIEAGKAYYMGEFLAYGSYGKNIFGITIPAGGFFVINRNTERDLDLLRGKYPELEDIDIVELDLIEVPPFIYIKRSVL